MTRLSSTYILLPVHWTKKLPTNSRGYIMHSEYLIYWSGIEIVCNKQNAWCNINSRQAQYRIVGGQGFAAHRVVAIQHRSHERLCNWNGRLQIKYCRIRRREINISREIQEDTHCSLRPGVNLHYKESKNNLAIWTDSPPSRLKHLLYHVSFRMTAVFFN